MVGALQENKVALVVGAAGIIGAAVAQRLRAEGLIVAGLDESAGADDGQWVAELTDRLALAAAVEDLRRSLGPVSILVVAPHKCDAAPIGEMDRPRWESLLRAHLGVATSSCAAVVPAMVDAGSGTVVIMSSWLALAGIPGEAYQAAATGTLLSFTKGFAMEVAPAGVRVNCVAVGPAESGSEQDLLQQGMGLSLPLGRRASPAEVAETVAFLINDGDFYVGQVFEPFAGAVV